jgi:hypothetical protein
MYDRQLNGLHIDGIFFFLAFFASWLLWLVLKVWSYKPPKPKKPAPMPSKWEMPSNWRN